MTRFLCILLALATAPDAVAAEKRPAGREEALASLDFREVIRSAKDRVFPAVVYIKVLQESHESGRKISREVAGSGVIISPEGEVLTNWHVVNKAVEVRCLLYDGRAFSAKVVGADKDTDLALVKLELAADAETIPHADLGRSTVLKEGDFVMAMGAPWGLSRSVSIGIVSCTRRFLPDNSEYSLWIQTDAAISPGNSGGPLVNTDGQVVGINTRGVMFGGDMGFAVPSDTIRHLVDQIRKSGRVNWSWTGLQLQALRDFGRNIYFEGTDGVIVAETDPESPARQAGLLARDRILKIGGQAVAAVTEEDLPAVRRLIGLLPKNQPVRIDLLRGEKAMNVRLVPREKGKVEGDQLDCPRWDFTVREINQFDTPDLHFHRQRGVFVYGVKQPGNAENAGLRRLDILLKIDGKEVTTLDDVKRLHTAALEAIDTQHRVIVTVLRSGLVRQAVLDYLRDFEKE
ncbi:MAG TPA: trypsin-like peptidase domain-containing protein [Phycisphaerae bacterium]|nr:trypsin-like peptidase domain-containing protein [Phycisphaerae bacterium]